MEFRKSLRRAAVIVRLLFCTVCAALALFPVSPLRAQASAFFSAADRAIYYYGRTQRSAQVLWSWPGSGLRVRYGNSASASLQFRAEDYPEGPSQGVPRMVWYRVDGGSWRPLFILPNVEVFLPLEVPPDRETHTLEVVKASEGRLTFVGIFLEPGGKLSRPAIPPRRIEIVGDSITAGFRLNGGGAYEAPADHDARATYGWILGEAFNAEVRLIAISGHGLVHNYDAPPEASQTMPQYYPLLHRGESARNTFSWQPHVIIVNLGTNDMAPPGPTSPDIFRREYSRFLSTLRARNRRALILALRPFGLFNGTMAVYPDEIRAAVETRRASGDGRVFYVDSAGWLGPGDFTDGVHPNAGGNAKAAAQLSAVIRQLAGW